jgi:ParB family transcriptional regulator, chromosome partitioning protein
VNSTADKRKVLGRGLDTLLPGRGLQSLVPGAPAQAAAQQSASTDSVREIAVELIDRSPYQPRTRFEEAGLQELADSMRVSGILQPVTVRALEGGRYQLVAGERRWLAAQRAGKATVPAIVRQLSNEQAMEIAIVENLQREDLNPVEQARAYERLSREFGLTQEQMAQRTGKERSSVANFLRLLKLPAPVLSLIESGQLSFGHGKALMPLDSPEAMLQLAQRAAAQAMSVRQLEAAVAQLLHPAPAAAKVERMLDPNVRQAEQTLQRSLGLRVQIHDNKGKGKIVVAYNSLEDFDRVLEALGVSR